MRRRLLNPPAHPWAPGHSAILGLALAVALAAAAPALANDTALNQGRHGPEPVGGGFTGAESGIRMVAERLDIAFGRKATRVRCRFTFRNTLAVPATQLVGFPDEGKAQDEASRRNVSGPETGLNGPLRQVRTLVDGRVVPATLKYGWVRTNPGGEGWVAGGPKDGMLMAWHVATVAFPPDRDVVVERHYVVDNGADVTAASFFEYVTHTGGPWKGRIGELVADVRLVDGLTWKDLVWPGDPLPKAFAPSKREAGRATHPAAGQWKRLSPTHLQLVWRDFEPSKDQDRAGFGLWIQDR